MDVTLPWSWPRAPPCTSGSLSEHVTYSWHTAHGCVQASVLVWPSAPANRRPPVWERQSCGFKKEPVHPAAEKPVDSAAFLPHFPFCSDLTPPQCHYSCRWSGALHTKVSFSHINMNIQPVWLKMKARYLAFCNLMGLHEFFFFLNNFNFKN